MTTAFQSNAFQNNSFQIDAAGGNSQSLAITLDGIAASVTQTLKHSQSVAATLGGITVAVSQTAKHSQSLAATLDSVTVAISQTDKRVQSLVATLDSVSVSITQGFASPFKTQSLAVTLDDIAVSISQIGPAPKDAIQMVHGWAPKRHEKGSYWHKLLSPPLEQKLEEMEPEIAEAIEAKAIKNVDTAKITKAQAERDMRVALDQLGYAYKKAYQEIYLQVVSEMKQAQEDEHIAHIVAMLL
jgi:hypothetical protein